MIDNKINSGLKTKSGRSDYLNNFAIKYRRDLVNLRKQFRAIRNSWYTKKPISSLVKANVRIRRNVEYTRALKAQYFFHDNLYLGPFKANGILCFTRVRRNYIFSLSDLAGRTIRVVSAGAYTTRRKLRVSPSVLEAAVRSLIVTMRTYGIRYVIVRYKCWRKKNF